jgi:hypothetical protein
MQKLLGSRPLLTMEPQLEGVFYVVRPEAISRQLPVVRDSSRTEAVTVEYIPVTGVPHQIHLSTTASSRTDTVEYSPVPGVAS